MTVRTMASRHQLSLAPAHRLRSVSPMVMRIAVGTVMAVHGCDKIIQGPTGSGDFPKSLDVPAPWAVGWGVSIAETLAGFLLVVGLLTRLTSVLLSMHLSVAAVLVNADTGFITPQQGAASGAGLEFPLLLVAAFIGLLFTGPGPLALDRALGIERAAEPTNPTKTNPQRAEAASPPSAVRVSLLSGVVGGAIGAGMSALANYLVVGVPDSAAANAVNHAVSGLISGFLAGFLGLLMHQRKHGRSSRSSAMAPTDGASEAVHAGPPSASATGA
ncbi:DoxX family protein [Streptomyces sp. NPDC002853]